MRGRVALVTLFLLLAGALSASATSNANYKDKFDSIGWGGSNGALPWSGPWREVGDDNDEKFGAVRVVSSGNCASGNCINIDASILANVGVRRAADTSVFGYAELCYDLNIIPGLELGGALRVQVKTGEGAWVTIVEYDLGTEVESHPEFDISDFASEGFQVRFLVTGVVNTSQVYIDNVEISGELSEEPTTTTTTIPTTTTTDGDDDDGTTTTTKPRPTTTTTRPSSTTTVLEETTTTTVTDTSTTTTTIPSDEGSSPTLVVAVGGGGDGPFGPGGPQQPSSGGGGIRQAGRGLQANFDSGLFGQVGEVSPITGVDFQARFSLAAEVIESTWVWMVLLATVIAYSIVSGMERRRSQLPG